MNELKIFYEKLSGCNLIALTPINEGRFYCRFYLDGLYIDRMFIKNADLQQQLILLSEDEETINEDGISWLKDKYISISKATDAEGALESINMD